MDGKEVKCLTLIPLSFDDLNANMMQGSDLKATTLRSLFVRSFRYFLCLSSRQSSMAYDMVRL
jgi:hypothetical protein